MMYYGNCNKALNDKIPKTTMPAIDNSTNINFRKSAKLESLLVSNPVNKTVIQSSEKYDTPPTSSTIHHFMCQNAMIN